MKMYKELFKYPNVVLVGKGWKTTNRKAGDKAIVCGVTQKLPVEALLEHEIIPFTIDGNQTDVIEVGEIVAPRTIIQAKERTDTWRPAPGGVSIAHFKVTAGTLGCWVFDEITGDRLILSNCHVLANSNDAELGDAILQQGPADGGRYPEHHVANLHRFQTIEFGAAPPDCPLTESIVSGLNMWARFLGSSHRVKAQKVNPQAVNRIDAAVAIPILPEVIGDFDILEIGEVAGIVDVGLGDEVEKSGRTTEHTKDRVLIVDATVNVSYGSAGTAAFENQIVAGPMSAGGDSGSLGVVRIGNLIYAFGLLFAGSDQITIFNPVADVLSTLGIRF